MTHEKNGRTSRRRFLGASVVAGAAAAGLRVTPGAARSHRRRRARVVQVIGPKAYDAQGNPATKPVRVMVDRAVMTLTGKTTAKAAWSSLFKPTEVVGLKPNCLGRQLCEPSPATVDAIIAGLRLAGVPDKNLVMWDMWGFSASPLSSRYAKTAMQVKPIRSWGFGSRRYKIRSGPAVRFTNALHKVDAVVNIPVIKDHSLAGITCALKNMALGSVPNPWSYHAGRGGNRNCDPMVAEIYALPPIKDKARLIVADAFHIIIDGGPQGNTRGRRKLSSVFAARDPVAMDRVAWTLIDQERARSRLPKLALRSSGAPSHVLSAAKLGLGVADPRRIEHTVKRL